MKAYLTIIIMGTGIILAIAGMLCPYFNYSYLYALFTPLLTISVMLIDAIGAIIIRKLPEKWFDSSKKIFISKPNERKFYEKIGIKKWKDKIPELGGFTNFHKDKIYDPKSPTYIKQFILECNYGSMIHLVTGILGYLIIFITPLDICFLMAIPVATVNLILNLLPYFVLRYNVSRLQTMLRFISRK